MHGIVITVLSISGMHRINSCAVKLSVSAACKFRRQMQSAITSLIILLHAAEALLLIA